MSQHDFSESRAVGGWNRRTEDWLFLETSTPSETMAGQEGRVPFSTSIHFLAHAEFSFLFFQISFFNWSAESDTLWDLIGPAPSSGS